MSKKKNIDALLIKKDSVIDHMRMLKNLPAYEVWTNLMLRQQAEIIEAGKKAKGTDAEAAWARLDGIDQALRLVPKWANEKKDSEKESPISPIDD